MLAELPANRYRNTPNMSKVVASLIALCALSFAKSEGTHAQSTQCDPALAVSGHDPWRYRLRGSRCEGRYLEPVGQDILRIVAYYQGASWRGEPPPGDLSVAWSEPTPRPVALRAVSLRWRTFYRMDATVEGGRGVFLWPTEVLRALHLDANDIALTATTSASIFGADRQVYVPLRAGPADSIVERAPVVLWLMSDSDLDEIQLAMSSLSGNRWSRPLSPFRRGTFVARRPIRVVLPEAPAGTYELLFLATGDRALPTLTATVVIPPLATRR